MSAERTLERIRKLLELSHSDNEHEAAQAAARAAELMSEHAVTEAMLRVVDADDAINAHVAERIIEGNLPDSPERRVAWRDRVASAVAKSLDCETYFINKELHAMGRESSVSAWRYTCAYLFAEIVRLADASWLAEGADLAAVGQTPRAWKGAFRLGAADVVATRLYEQRQQRRDKERAKAKELAGQQQALLGSGTEAPQLALVRIDNALAVLDKDRSEVKAAFEQKTKGWRSVRGIGNSTRQRSGYQAGRAAGHNISLGGARAALKG